MYDKFIIIKNIIIHFQNLNYMALSTFSYLHQNIDFFLFLFFIFAKEVNLISMSLIKEIT